MAADYSVKMTFRNDRILSRMRALGIETQSDLAREAGVKLATVNAIVTMRRAPMNQRGEWGPGVEDIAGVLCCDPDDLFTERQRTMALPTSTAELHVSEDQAMALASGDDMDLRIEAQKLLGLAKPGRERDVVERRMHGETLDEVAGIYGVQKERIRQIEARGLRRIKAAVVHDGAELKAALLSDRISGRGN